MTPHPAAPVWSRPLAVIALLAVLLAFVRPASAQETPFLTERVTDTTGTLEDIGRIEDALDDLQDEHGIQLWVLFVDTTEPMTVTGYADEVAAANSFGGNDALLVVAIDDRSDAAWLGPLLGEVTDVELDELLANELETRLADGDFDGAVTAFAAGLGEVSVEAAPTAVPTATGPGGSDGASEGGGISIWPILGVIGAVIAAIFGFRWFRRRTGRGGGRPAAKAKDLDGRANQLLLEVDELLQDARDELGFAEAQFSEADVRPFRSAIEQAAGELKSAFALRQKLDDNIPEPPDERKQALEQIIVHTESAKARIQAETARIEELRNLERNAPSILAAMPSLIDTAERRIPGVEAAFAGLKGYADVIWQPLDGNVVEARKRLAYAKEAAAQGAVAAEAGQRSDAAFAARAGQTALTEADALLDAIDHQLEAVTKARDALPGELAAAEADVRGARNAAREGRVTTSDDALVRVESQLEQAKREAAGARPDVLTALRLAQEANSGADAVLARIQEERERERRALASFDATLRRAETSYQRAADYIHARRGGVGREARTRLAEAEMRLDSARSLRGRDLAQATSEAESAERMAGEALRRARSDFEGYDDGGYSGGYRARRPDPRSVASGMGGQILGGILGGILTGAMRGGGGFPASRRGGFGGSTWGMPGRSSGGGFRMPSGGGGRSRGGRW